MTFSYTTAHDKTLVRQTLQRMRGSWRGWDSVLYSTISTKSVQIEDRMMLLLQWQLPSPIKVHTHGPAKCRFRLGFPIAIVSQILGQASPRFSKAVLEPHEAFSGGDEAFALQVEV